MVSLVRDKITEIKPLCERHGVVRLEIFGSAADDAEYDAEQSDIDFLVDFPPDHSFGPWMRDFFALRDSLTSVLQKPVDLVMSSSLTDPHVIREVNKTRQLIYAR